MQGNSPINQQAPVLQKGKSSIDIEKLKQAVVNFIVPLIALVLSLIIGLTILYPSYTDLPELESELESKKQLRTTLKNKAENLNNLIDFKSVVDENSDLVNKVLISEQKVPALLTQIDRIANESGVRISKLNYSLGSTGGSDVSQEYNYDFVTVNISIVGTFGEYVTFLSSVENAARLIDVVQLRYGFTETEEGPQVSSSLVLVSPYLFVTSDAVTDEPVDLDIRDPEFTKLINDIKSLKFYDPNDVDLNVPVVETPEEEEETTEEGSPAPVAPISENTQQESLFGTF